MKSRLAAVLCCTMALGITRAADAKAHLIVVYQAQSEAALVHNEAVLAKDVTARIAAIPGYDSQLALTSGTPAQTAQRLGAVSRVDVPRSARARGRLSDPGSLGDHRD